MIENYLLLLKELRTELTREELENINYKSITNFLLYFDKLTSNSEKMQVENLIKNYFKEIESENYRVNKEKSRSLFFNYISKIGLPYQFQLGFKVTMGFKASLFTGAIIDIILLTIGYSKYFYYLPITTFLLYVFNRYRAIFYGRKNKLFGLNY